MAEFLETELPELPENARTRLEKDYRLGDYTARVLTGDPPSIQLFDQAVSTALSQLEEKHAKKVPESVANLLCNELFALVREHETGSAIAEMESGEASVKHSKVNGEQLGTIAALAVEGTISNTMAKKLLKILYSEEQGSDPRIVANDRGFKLITDADELEQICRQVIDENPEELERYKLGGKFAVKITKFLLGKAMQKSQMNAHPERLGELMTDMLEKVASK